MNMPPVVTRWVPGHTIDAERSPDGWFAMFLNG
jgi:hypothetical protein